MKSKSKFKSSKPADSGIPNKNKTEKIMKNGIETQNKNLKNQIMILENIINTETPNTVDNISTKNLAA